jgi:DNA-directed RNA polymerase subunit RPC12/RpoP
LTIVKARGYMRIWCHSSERVEEVTEGETKLTLFLDEESRLFKIATEDNTNVISFSPLSLIEITEFDAGFSKRHSVDIKFRANNDTGSEYYLISFYNKGEKESSLLISRIEQIHSEFAYEQMARLLKTRERVAFNDIVDSMAGFGIPVSIKEAQQFAESLISSGAIKGVVNDSEFLSLYALQRKSEVVHYNIVTTFDFSNGLLSVKCPSCGSTNITKQKSNEARCTHCGSTYIIPNKVLDLI